MEENQDDEICETPPQRELLEFQKGIWSNSEEHNENAYWIREETYKYENLRGMKRTEIILADVVKALNNVPN